MPPHSDKKIPGMELFTSPHERKSSSGLDTLDQRSLFTFAEPEPASLADIRFLTEYQPLRGGKNPNFDYDSDRPSAAPQGWRP